MKLSPLDIRNQTFKKVLRGLDAEEVQAFLEMIAEEFERLHRENLEMKTNVGDLQAEVDRFKDIEDTLQETLRTAQKAAEDVRENARKEGQLIVKEAEMLGNRAVEKARAQVHRIRSEIVELKNQRDLFLAKFNALLQAQSDFLAELSMTNPDSVEEPMDEGGEARESGSLREEGRAVHQD